MTFYKTIDGKQFPVHENELKKYKEICKKIWGACPYDMLWAMESPLYKNELKNGLTESKNSEGYNKDKVPNNPTI